MHPHLRTKGIMPKTLATKQAEAAARQIECAALHPMARLILIGKRPGNSARERARITGKKVVKNGN